ncbi:MAG TPA: DUF4440 domain-containing protein [Candidatus Dormibacteraeota bacterium]|nr:DUF4440 domain-containing protein [Candidatus Dormibacteraeota bacterium]
MASRFSEPLLFSEGQARRRPELRKLPNPHLFLVLLLPAIILSSVGCFPQKAASISQDELVRRSQELMDSVARGDQGPWKKYFAADAMYFDEKGRALDKDALVADIAPFPSGYSGSIKIKNPQSRFIGNTAIVSFDEDETETIFGQTMCARYHETDTWIQRSGEWQIVASQVLRYYADPAPGKADATKFPDYIGKYELNPGGATVTVSAEGTNLFEQKLEKPKQLLIPEAADIFFRKGLEGRWLFRRTDDGKIDAIIDRRNNEDIVWKKIS